MHNSHDISVCFSFTSMLYLCIYSYKDKKLIQVRCDVETKTKNRSIII